MSSECRSLIPWFSSEFILPRAAATPPKHARTWTCAASPSCTRVHAPGHFAQKLDWAYCDVSLIYRELPPQQLDLLQAVLAVQPETVAVLISGGMISEPTIMREHQNTTAGPLPKAIIQLFYPGAMGGTALAEALLGTTGFSGRLPVTVVTNTAQLPPYLIQNLSAPPGRTHRSETTLRSSFRCTCAATHCCARTTNWRNVTAAYNSSGLSHKISGTGIWKVHRFSHLGMA